MTTRKLDPESIKQRTDIVELAGRYTSLKRWTASGEMAGPCPTCLAGSDGFHVHPDGWWKCYTCHDKRADAIELVQWLGLAHDFVSACTWLDGPAAPVATAPMPKKKAKTKAQGWSSDKWQAGARREVELSLERMAGPDGESARTYLAGRGIEADTWRAWRVGFATPYHPARQEHRPAIAMPWTGNGRIKAIQYRYIDEELDKGERFSQHKGGERTLYGIDLVGEHWQTLILCEGELNAISIWQAIRSAGLQAVDVVSIGAEGNAASAHAIALAERYQITIVWTDKAERAQGAMADIPNAHGLRSPQHAGQEMDANDILQAGLLEDFITMATERFTQARQEEDQDQTPAMRDQTHPVEALPLGRAATPAPGAWQEITLVLPADTKLPTPRGKWELLADGSIKANYTPHELELAMVCATA